MLHSRLRGGNAAAGRGAASFIAETISRVRDAGATGALTLRADSGFRAQPRARQPEPVVGHAASLAELTESQRAVAMRRWELLRPHVEDGVALAVAARQAGVALRTAQRWLACFRAAGLVGLAPKTRRDRGTRRFPEQLVALVEGLALQRPKPSMAWVHRQVGEVARRESWPEPSYATVLAIVTGLDPALVTLAQQGDRAYRQAFELLHRHEADRSNAAWQADHTQLELILASGERPWLTAILDDRSRAAAGYSLSLTEPSALHTALALRQAIWHKPEATWEVCGIPEVLYTDHGSDFTSKHLDQVAADLDIQLVHSAPGQPRGRGKIERFFRTCNQLLISTLPGYAPTGRALTAPGLSLSGLDERLRGFLVDDYNQRVHADTGQAPQQRWSAGGFLPRLPDSAEALDLLLATVATPRRVHRDGIRFAGQRYLDATLAGYVGEAVTIRYDPRDVAEVRVFHRDRFVCRAICPELADRTVSLKDVTAARRQCRRQLRGELDQRRAVVDELLHAHEPAAEPGTPAPEPSPPQPRLKRYRND